MKLRFITRENEVEIRAPLKESVKLVTFGFCHPDTVPLIRSGGIRKHINLIRIP